MRIGAGLGALVAAGAFLQVEDEQVLGMHQALIEEVTERQLLHVPQRLGVG